jgi:hypothetical protein
MWSSCVFDKYCEQLVHWYVIFSLNYDRTVTIALNIKPDLIHLMHSSEGLTVCICFWIGIKTYIKTKLRITKSVLLIWTLSYCHTPITEMADLGDDWCWSLFVIL